MSPKAPLDYTPKHMHANTRAKETVWQELAPTIWKKRLVYILFHSRIMMQLPSLKLTAKTNKKMGQNAPKGTTIKESNTLLETKILSENKPSHNFIWTNHWKFHRRLWFLLLISGSQQTFSIPILGLSGPGSKVKLVVAAMAAYLAVATMPADDKRCPVDTIIFPNTYQHPPRGGVWTVRDCFLNRKGLLSGTPTPIHLAPRKEGPGISYTCFKHKIEANVRKIYHTIECLGLRHSQMFFLQSNDFSNLILLQIAHHFEPNTLPETNYRPWK